MTAMLRGRMRRANRAASAGATLPPPAQARRTSGSRITSIAGSDETGDGQYAAPCGIVTQADPVYKSVRRPVSGANRGRTRSLALCRALLHQPAAEPREPETVEAMMLRLTGPVGAAGG